MPIDTAWSIDWISATFKNGASDLDIRKAMSFGFPLKTWTQTVARFGYSVCFIHPLGHSVMANYGRPEMGVHLSFGGRALSAISEGGHPATKLLDWCLTQGAKVTRIDLAIDVFAQEIDIRALASAPRVAAFPGSAKKWRLWEGDDGGCTAYIGSRKSDKFLRVYDKAAEQKRKDVNWTRFELELKGDAAKAAAFQMGSLTDAERPVFVKGLMRALFNPDDELYQSIMDAEAVILTTVKDTSDKTLEWLLNTVCKSIANTMHRRSDIDVWGLIVEGVRANLVAGAMGGPDTE